MSSESPHLSSWWRSLVSKVVWTASANSVFCW
jgi:hypothetical protein